jgi:hypothetical protein
MAGLPVAAASRWLFVEAFARLVPPFKFQIPFRARFACGGIVYNTPIGVSLMKTLASALALAAMTIATPALANDQVVAGATVYGPEGNQVGTILQVENGQTVLDTGTHQVPLAVEMYGVGETGPTITVTKVQLDTMIEQQMAAANAARDAALVEGATIMTADSQTLGTVGTIEGDNVLVVRADDAGEFTVPRNYFAAVKGQLVARLTMAQVDAALAGAAGANGGTGAAE